jgi:heme-degrading monooxygenase HmoA
LVGVEEETVVITRMWRGWTRCDQADRYEEHYRGEVVADLRQVPGFRGARLLRRTIGEETEFVSLTFFEDLDAVRSFAGSAYETVVAEEARKVLIGVVVVDARIRVEAASLPLPLAARRR